MDNKYLELVAEFFPNTQCYSVGPNYSDLVYVSGDPLPGVAVLDTKYIDNLKSTLIAKCAKEANEVQKQAQFFVTGTYDVTQTKVYEQKFMKAYTYKQKIDAGVTPVPELPDIVVNEVAETGEDPNNVIDRILSNGQLSWAYLDPILGTIEGLRRKYSIDIKASADDEASIKAVPWPIWPDVEAIIAAKQSGFVS